MTPKLGFWAPDNVSAAVHCFVSLFVFHILFVSNRVESSVLSTSSTTSNPEHFESCY
jgi:hypothetical protein